MRNIDRLRKMSDKQIIDIFENDLICDETDNEYCISCENCSKCRLEWLKKEYKGDDIND